MSIHEPEIEGAIRDWLYSQANMVIGQVLLEQRSIREKLRAQHGEITIREVFPACTKRMAELLLESTK